MKSGEIGEPHDLETHQIPLALAGPQEPTRGEALLEDILKNGS